MLHQILIFEDLLKYQLRINEALIVWDSELLFEVGFIHD